MSYDPFKVQVGSSSDTPEKDQNMKNDGPILSLFIFYIRRIVNYFDPRPATVDGGGPGGPGESR